MDELSIGMKLSVDPENDLETGKLIGEFEEPPSVGQVWPVVEKVKGSILDDDLEKAR